MTMIERNDYLATVKEASDHLLTIINEILDFSKIEAGKITIDKEDFDLHYCLEKIIKMYRYKAEEKGLNLTMNIQDDVPRYVVGDQLRLNQIITNIIGNALKFTDKGTITLTVDRIQGEGDCFRAK